MTETRKMPLSFMGFGIGNDFLSAIRYHATPGAVPVWLRVGWFEGTIWPMCAASVSARLSICLCLSLSPGTDSGPVRPGGTGRVTRPVGDTGGPPIEPPGALTGRWAV